VVTLSFSEWLQTLTWDLAGPPSFGEVGLSWLEIGLSISCMAGAMLPIQRQDSEGTTWLIFPSQNCDIVAADIANSAKQMWDSFHSLMLGAPPLKLSRGLQGSTFLLGHRKEASGIRPRSQIANAAMVIPQAVALLEDRSNYQAKLEASWRCDDFLLVKVRWDEAKKRLKIVDRHRPDA